MATESPSVKRTRPVNLNLFTISFPIPAIVSILHRLSGVLLFLFVPLIVWALDASLSSPDSFMGLQGVFNLFIVKFLVWVFLSALAYHMLAGVRHLIMNIGFAESLPAMRLTSKIVLGLGVVMAVIVGIWLW